MTKMKNLKKKWKFALINQENTLEPKMIIIQTQDGN